MAEASRTIWWLHPGIAVSLITGSVAVAAYTIPESSYVQYWKVPRYFGEIPLQFAMYCIVAFLFGTLIGNSRLPCHGVLEEAHWRTKIPWSAAIALFRIGFYLCLIGYLLWALSAINRGLSLQILVQVFTGQKNALEDLHNLYLVTIPGITTLANLDAATIVLGFLIGTAYGWRLVWKPCLTVFLLAALRAFLHMERLAVIELVVPFAVLYLRMVYLEETNPKRLIRRLVRFLPIIGPSALFCLFTCSEYTRSWINFYSSRNTSLLEFASLRLLGYYVTALNNGAFLIERLNIPLGAPIFSLDFLYRFPLLNESVKSMFPNALESGAYMKLLEAGANPEFNNADGILLPVIDYGLAGALLYWFLAGLICGVLYQLFRRKHPVGLCLYPILFVGILEVPRILFWTSGRIFPTWCLLLASCVIFVTSKPLLAENREPTGDSVTASDV